MYENYLDSRSHSFGTSSSSRTSPTVLPHRFPAYAIKTESGTSCTVSLYKPQDRIAAKTHTGMLWAACSLQFCFRSSPPIIPKKQFAIGVYT